MIGQWKIGDRIQNRWEIHRILEGGMGSVYVVYDHVSHEALAAKIFQDKFLNSEVARARFQQEALSWVNLDIHRNVTQARFVENISGKPFLFLEYVSGGDLGGWIGTPRLMQDFPQALNFAIQFCDGMKHAFSKGIQAHRDIKPANCLITEDNVLKVTDFGLAKVFSPSSENGKDEKNSTLSEKWGKLFKGPKPQLQGNLSEQNAHRLSISNTGRAAGTCTHMAPEQFDDAKHVDVRADIYSFGIMLFQMIEGELPFKGQTWKDLEYQHKRQASPRLNNSNLKLDSIFQTCTAKDPADRFSDFGAVRNQLADIYERITGKPVPQPLEGKELDSAQWSDKGLSLNNLGRSVEALTCFDQAIALSPEYWQAWNNKSVSLYNLKQYDDSLICCDRTLGINPNSFYGWTNKGLNLRALGACNEAEICFDHALELNAYHAASWTNKGSLLKEQGRFEDAIACYNRALELDPRSADAWTSKGGTLRVMQRPEEALACHNQALNIHPQYAEAWSNKGAVLRMLGRLPEAITAYERALALNPRLADAWYNKGTAWLRLQSYENSLLDFDHALALNPRLDRAWVNKGIALRGLERYDEAIDCFNRQIEINPNDAGGWFNKGSLLVDIFQRFDEALPCFVEAEKLGFKQATQGITLCQQMLNRS